MILDLKSKPIGGFNPIEKYPSNWIIYPWFGVKKHIWNHHLGKDLDI